MENKFLRQSFGYEVPVLEHLSLPESSGHLKGQGQCLPMGQVLFSVVLMTSEALQRKNIA